jgi:hypothetical protein
LAIRIRDELGEVWSDQRFRGLFGVRGKPGISPAQLMIVLVLAMAENLTDRQAADMVRRAIDWKYALGLPLEDPGFDFTGGCCIARSQCSREPQIGVGQIAMTSSSKAAETRRFTVSSVPSS